MTLATFLEAARARPVAALLEVGSLVVCVGLLAGTVLALASGPPEGAGGPWLAVAVVGAAFAAFWTAAYPLYARLRHGS